MAIRNFGKFSAFFTQKEIADIVSELPKPLTPMADLLFPASARRQKNSPLISIDDIKQETGAIPLIRRNGHSIPVDSGESSRALIEVSPVSPSLFFSGKDINDLINLGEADNIKAFIAEKIEYLRDRVSETIEVMSRQSLSGKINYPYATVNGVAGTYEVELGTMRVIKPVNISGFDIPAIQKWLESLYQEQAKTGASGKPAILMGSAVYQFVINKFIDDKLSHLVAWEEDGVTIMGKYKIRTSALAYTLPGEKTVRQVVGDNEVITLDLANTGKLFFASLDDMDANFAPLPFYAYTIETQNPSGVEIVGISKPLPAPALSKMCKQVVALT
jgi:hypothetical protein